MTQQAIIIGYSGHAFVLIDILLSNKVKIVGYCDKAEKSSNPYDLKYVGFENDDNVLEIVKNYDAYIGIGDNIIRAKTFEKFSKNGINCPIIIHKYSFISSQAILGMGTVVMPGVVINSNAKIGNAVICNSSCVIEHECLISDFSHIAPGAVLAGNVSVGRNSFIGANAVIKQGVKIGSDVIIGAGAVVINDVADGATVYGNPAK